MQTETNIAVLRFLKTRPSGTGAKFSEICRCVGGCKAAIYDAIEDMERRKTIICNLMHFPRRWRVNDNLSSNVLDKILEDIACR